MHLTRYYMYTSIRDALKQPLKGMILGISGIKNFYPLIDMENSKLIEKEYPDIDMQELPFDGNTFDVVISDQVIEHLEDCQRAIRESHRVLKEGGIAIHTTCFINYIHPCPGDFWRFSPDALRYLCRDFSQVVHCGSWGNRAAILLCFLSDRLRLMSIPETRGLRHFIATYNEERYPIVTWVIARK